MPSIEDILLLKAQQEAAAQPTLQEAALTGAALGSISGATIGTIPHNIGRGVNSIADAVNPVMVPVKAEEQYFGPVPKNQARDERTKKVMDSVKQPRGKGGGPGWRAAGGLVGMILGGGLGVGIRNEMIKSSPAAEMLAKAQIEGDLNPTDRLVLEQILAEEYSKMGLR